jgi:hypothetical protein
VQTNAVAIPRADVAFAWARSSAVGRASARLSSWPAEATLMQSAAAGGAPLAALIAAAWIAP